MIEVEEFFTHLVVTCDYQASFVAAECVVYIKGDATAIAVALEVFF